jgi:hypothetical protein
MRGFDASCLTSVEPLSAKQIAAIRKRAGVFQTHQVERILRRWAGYPLAVAKTDDHADPEELAPT